MLALTRELNNCEKWTHEFFQFPWAGQIYYFRHSPSKTIKNDFYSIQKDTFIIFSYSLSCIYFPFFVHFPDLKRQMEVEQFIIS